MQVVLPLTPGQEPKFTADPEELNEHWVCDGKSIFEFEGRKKQLIQRELPPEMRGKQIVEGPLPFLFRVCAEMIKVRYWIRAILPPPMKGAVTLEAEPKTREDAANFRRWGSSFRKTKIFCRRDWVVPPQQRLYDVRL